MVKGSILNHGIRAASALALLVAVMTSQIRPSRSTCVPSQPECLRRNFAIPSSHSTRPSAASVSPRAVPVKALPSENNEKELSGTIRPVGCSLDLSAHASPKPARDLTAFGLDRAPHPLRC